jgi:LemA protein
MKKTLLIVIAVVVVVGLYLFTSYNRFVTLSEDATTQWQQVETQYQRRFDLIPNLVASVQGIMKQEQSIFTALAEARTRYSGAVSTNEKAIAASEVESALSRLLVVVENYPQLRSTETVNTLMSQLEGTENRISTERGRYNEVVRTYNLSVKRFPGKIIAGIFGFEEKAYFEAKEGAEDAPQVEL